MTSELETGIQGDTPTLEEPGLSSDSDDLQKPILNQIQVQDVIKRERQKAYEKGQRDKAMELQQQQSAQQNQEPVMQQPPQPMQQQQQGLGGMQQLSQDQIAQMIAEQAPLAVQEHINQIKTQGLVNSFVGKMEAAEQNHPGLEQKLNNLNYNDQRMHKLIEMSNGLENTGDVMNELLTNPHKMSSVLADIINQPFLAQQQLMSLSNSIKVNNNALAEQAQANDPMSQLKPSTSAGLADSKDLSVNDLRKIISRRK